MTLENLGPLLDELCAVLRGKGCTVREVAVTYAPWATEDVPDPGSSCSRGDAAGTLHAHQAKHAEEAPMAL
jgi:hypothetical protein